MLPKESSDLKEMYSRGLWGTCSGLLEQIGHHWEAGWEPGQSVGLCPSNEITHLPDPTSPTGMGLMRKIKEKVWQAVIQSYWCLWAFVSFVSSPFRKPTWPEVVPTAVMSTQYNLNTAELPCGHSHIFLMLFRKKKKVLSILLWYLLWIAEVSVTCDSAGWTSIFWKF